VQPPPNPSLPLFTESPPASRAAPTAQLLRQPSLRTPGAKAKKMPPRAARSGTRGRPPFGFGSSCGSRGSMASQSLSGVGAGSWQTIMPSQERFLK
jgi:hypothetical protein